MNDLKQLCGFVKEGSVKEKELLAEHTTFRIGGAADYYVEPASEKELFDVLSFCKEKQIPFFIMGKGSNLLVGDGGIRGAVISISKKMSECRIEKKEDGYHVRAQAGISLSNLAAKLAQKGIKGFEFASGIPGTLGGAVFMNAGAYGGEIKDSIRSARILMPDGEVREFFREELSLGYRQSAVMHNGGIVLSAEFILEEGNREEIQMLMKELAAKRLEKQPLEYPSAGSTFKRPEGYFAGKLIMDAGLRGYRVGGAMVSEKHCGFVVNAGDATARDVCQLMEDVSRIVYEKYGVTLEPEVRMVGEF